MDLGYINLKNSDIENISSLKTLQYLSLELGEFLDKNIIPFLYKLKKLKFINLAGTKIYCSEIKKLKKHIVGLKVKNIEGSRNINADEYYNCIDD